MGESTTANHAMALSATLENRIDRLAVCQGHWVLIRDDDHSQLEWNGIATLWNDEPIRDRVRMLQDLGQCIFAARRESTPWDIDELRESLLSQLNEYPTIAA